MKPNLTLLFQIGNFLISYAVITKLFLKPAYQALVAEDSYRSDLKDLVIDEQHKLDQQRAYKESQWKICQLYFKEHRPHVNQSYISLLAESYTIKRMPSLTKQEVAMSAQELARSLQDKVIHYE